MFYQNLSATAEDWTWWNTVHGWESGMKGWRSWIIISPGYLGPNSLPVPEIKKGLILPEGEFEFGAESHFKSGDPTQDIFARFYLPFGNNKIAFEGYGVIVERYAMSEAIRNERFARDFDGKGWAQGDFYFSTLIQLAKDRKFPDTMIRLATKTATGDIIAARYTDSPGYFIDFSFSKPFTLKNQGMITPYFSPGFYCWQTNDEENLQNDAFMYGAGIDLKKGCWNFSACFSGYIGYKNQRDDPMILNFDLRKDFKKKAIRFQLFNGLKSWDYTTVRISAIWYFRGID